MALVDNDEIFEKPKRNRPRRRKKPLVLVFDEKAREDFLTGFRKRKLERKKKAQEELEKELKAERRKIKRDARSVLLNLGLSNRDIPELAAYDNNTDVVDMDTHQVEITELDAATIARKNNWIGTNQVKYKQSECNNENKVEEEVEEEITGMEIGGVKKEKKTLAAKPSFKSQKDLKKYVKQQATKNVKASKVFQKKKDIEAIKNKKRKVREERKAEKKKKKIKTKREKHRKRR